MKNNKVCIVTGASRGLGRGIALVLAQEEGCKVYVTARNEEALKSLAEEAVAGQFRQVLADYEEIRDAYNIGAYTVGMNPKSDYAIKHIDAMNEFLQQGSEPSTFDETLAQLSQVFSNQ